MLCAYECYQVGGPWIAENPSCPVHGSHAIESREAKSDQIHSVLIRVWDREISADEGMQEINWILDDC